MMRKLRPHQLEAFEYTLREPNPALFMEMRLGKTLVAIRRCMLYRPQCTRIGLRVLVVAPNSALGSWEDELTEEGVPFFRVCGSKRERKKTLDIFAVINKPIPMFFLINREAHLSTPEMKSLLWDAVILDESTFIKNFAKAKVSKYFVNNFRSVQHRWCLTGTPAPETLLELYPQMKFLNDSFMGSTDYWKFRSKYFNGSRDGSGWQPNKGVRRQIETALAQRAFVLTREAAGIHIPKVYENRMIEMPESIRKQYDRIEQHMEIDEDNSTIWKMVQWQWLRRLCGGWIDDEEIWTGKRDELIELLTGELKNEQVVVWYTYNREIDSCLEACHEANVKAARLDGSVEIEEREKTRRLFQAGKTQVLLVQQAVAQTGMNLSAADTAIYFSEPVGYMARKQTEDRILDTEKKSTLLYIHLLVENSIDEDIRMALKMKNWASNLLLSRAIKGAMYARLQNRVQ